ncbi:transposase [Amycolatopsis sp. NPDC054798]
MWILSNQPVPAKPDPDAPPLPLQDNPGHHIQLGGMPQHRRPLRPRPAQLRPVRHLPSLLDSPIPAIPLWLGHIGFALGKYAVGFSVWFTEWTASTLAFDWIKTPARDLEGIWQTSVIGELKLREIAMRVATYYLGLLFARGLTTWAWRETASTIATEPRRPGIVVNHKRAERLMREHGLAGSPPPAAAATRTPGLRPARSFRSLI